MTALKIIGIVLLCFLLLSFVRVGVLAEFGGALRVQLRVGPVRRMLLPKRKKKAKERAAASPKPGGNAPTQSAKPKTGKKHRSWPKPTFAELRELVGALFGVLGRTLRRTCKRTRIDPLELCVRFAGDDPADVAQTYGYACAALWSVMPRLEELFYIPKPSICLDMDFQAERTTVEGTVGVSLRVCDLFAILFTLAPPLVKWYLRYRRAHRNDPVKPEAEAEATPTQGAANAAQNGNETEKRTA